MARGNFLGVGGQKLEFRVGVGEWRVRSRRWSEGSSERIRRIRRGSARRSLRPPPTTTIFGDRPHDRPKNQGSDGVCPQFYPILGFCEGLVLNTKSQRAKGVFCCQCRFQCRHSPHSCLECPLSAQSPYPCRQPRKHTFHQRRSPQLPRNLCHGLS